MQSISMPSMCKNINQIKICRRYQNLILLISIFVITSLLSRLSFAEQNIFSQMRMQGETLNFELQGQSEWDYDIKRVQSDTKTKLQIMIKGIKPSQVKFKEVSNPFVTKAEILKETVDGRLILEFTLADESIESFDYLTDQPSKVVIDFYKNEEKYAELQKRKTQKNKKEFNVASKVNDNDSLKVANTKKSQMTDSKNALSSLRDPASVDFLTFTDQSGITTLQDEKVDLIGGLFDGADEKFNRFKIKKTEIIPSAVAKGLENYYLKFPMLFQDFSFWKMMKQNSPTYDIAPKNTDENKQARLLKKLFDHKRYHVLRKTTDWFENKFPQSTYLELIYYMNAEAQLELWKKTGLVSHFDDAQSFFNDAQLKFPNSELSERTELYNGFLYVDKKDYLTSARKFNTLIESPKYKGRPSQEYAKIGLAYSLLKVKKLEDAIRLLNDVELNSKNELTQAEAGFRKGDFYFQENKYKEAVAEYDKALEKHKKLSPLFPNVYFNKMESLFRDKNPELAHQVALEFVQKFPTHEYAPYALTRVGELLEILGAEQSRSIGAFLETHFRYGDSPKTIIARLHMLSTRMKVMKPLEVEQTLKKMNELSQKSDLENVEQFKTTMIADGYTRRKEYDNAIEILTHFYQKEPNREDSEQVTDRIVNNINEQIKNFSENDQFKDVLKKYNKYADSWLKMKPRIDTQFYVAKAYQKADACSTALKKYDKIEKQILHLNLKKSNLIGKSFQELPSLQEVHLQQAECLFDSGQLQQAYEKLQTVDEPQKLSHKDQINRVHYASLIFEKKGETQTAIRFLSELVKTWENKPALLGDSLLKLAELEQNSKNFKSAMLHLNRLNNDKVDQSYQLKALKKMVEISLNQSEFETAITNLQILLEKFDATENLSAERYKLGELYFNKGERKNAEKIWADLKGKDSQIWIQLAENKLKDSNWSAENNKYLKRIPAMTKSESGKNLEAPQ